MKIESIVLREIGMQLKSLLSDVSASRRYWSEDIVEPEVKVTAKGTI
jgi:hypothetical protein